MVAKGDVLLLLKQALSIQRISKAALENYLAYQAAVPYLYFDWGRLRDGTTVNHRRVFEVLRMPSSSFVQLVEWCILLKRWKRKESIEKEMSP